MYNNIASLYSCSKKGLDLIILCVVSVPVYDMLLDHDLWSVYYLVKCEVACTCLTNILFKGITQW